MDLVYTLGVRLFLVVIRVVALFNDKAAKWVAGRGDLIGGLRSHFDPSDQPIWFHCASLGEFEQGRPLIEAYRKRHTEVKILLTFFSPSGYEVRKNYQGADWVCYLPVDLPGAVDKFVAQANPRAVVFVKYEFWPNAFRILSKRNIPTYVVSAIFWDELIFFKPILGPWSRKMLHLLDHIFVQDEGSKVLLEKYGITHVTVSGDTRFDRVAAIASEAAELEAVSEFAGDSKVLVSGSSWPQEDEMVMHLLNNSPADLKVIVAPHEIKEEKMAKLEAGIKAQVVRYSQLDQVDPAEAQVLIIDNIGLLSRLYRYGHVALIGGGFGSGIHNILEAATFGMPLLFGPNFQRFKEAVDLVDLGGARVVKTKEEFEMQVRQLLDSAQELEEISAISRKYVQDHVGATDLIIKRIG